MMRNRIRKNTYQMVLMLIIVLMCITGCGRKKVKWTVYPGKIVVEYVQEIGRSDEMTVSNDTSDEVIENDEEVVMETAEKIAQGEIENVDLIFFMGQSNMAGHGGNAQEAPAVSEEAGLEYRVISDPDVLHPIEEPFGANENKDGGLFDADNKKLGSMVSSFINRYHELTDKKVIGVSASVGGMAMDLWLNDGVMDDVIARIKDSITYLSDNQYNIEHVYVMWLQGESDGSRGVTGEDYTDMFYQFMNEVLAAGVEKVFIITPGRVYYDANAYNTIIAAQKKICENDDNFVLATSVLSDIDISMMTDAYHYNQEALNLVGEEAAEGVAAYAYGISSEDENIQADGENDTEIIETNEEIIVDDENNNL